MESLRLLGYCKCLRHPETITIVSQPVRLRIKHKMNTPKRQRVLIGCVILLLASSKYLLAQPAPLGIATQIAGGVSVVSPAGTMTVQLLTGSVVHVVAHPPGVMEPPTDVLAAGTELKPLDTVQVSLQPAVVKLSTARIAVVISLVNLDIEVSNASGEAIIRQRDPIKSAAGNQAEFLHQPFEDLYGMSGLDIRDNSNTLLRNAGADIRAGAQGSGGAPFFFSRTFGVLIDSTGGSFNTEDGLVQFRNGSRKVLEDFICAGPPMEVISVFEKLTGLPPLPPKWTLGFLNSQWGPDEADLLATVATYRHKHIPIDGFILDYDWKAWGEDNYGEWRWNSTSGVGAAAPDKFPHGASGQLAKDLAAQGIHLVGILKPRVVLGSPGITQGLSQAATYAYSHHFWYANEPESFDGGIHRLARDVDFRIPEVRTWYWRHLEPSFQAGMDGWWNDEADHILEPDGSTWDFSSMQGFNMGRMLYEGQRSVSNKRVWSLNRNYFFGAQRFGYAEWSGDIHTGFDNMANQRARMLSTIDIGEPQWSMDTGGFFGHASAENYVRWVQFAAFTPIMRVHGDHDSRRQPWIYGDHAERVATAAIRLRYRLLPYIYSNEHQMAETGIGIVRPLFWLYSEDSNARDITFEWMFGDSLLVSPVIASGAVTQRIYLPKGTWYDYSRGQKIEGGQTIDYPVSNETWEDIPLFVKAGGIVATQSDMEYVDEAPVRQLQLDLFPGEKESKFVFYDDDGSTYSYEGGQFYSQSITLSRSGSGFKVTLGSRQGQWQSGLHSFALKLHAGAHRVMANGKLLPISSACSEKDDLCWIRSEDRFGPTIWINVPAAQAIVLAVD
jgi:alpha-glucosidase (family GH31 glycosyl hydrolase)